MSIAIQTIIVAMIGIGVVGYLMGKIVNRVHRRNKPQSPCCGCDTPCSLKEINNTKQEKSSDKYCKVEK